MSGSQKSNYSVEPRKLSEKVPAEDAMDEDVDMDTHPPKPRDPNDLSEYNLDDYDDEEKGAGRLGYIDLSAIN